MQRVDFRDQISKNKRKSFFLILLVVLIIIALGYAVSIAFSSVDFFVMMAIASVIAIIYVSVSYYNSHKIAIASVGAKLAKQSEYKLYHDIVEGLTIASGLPKPKLYVMDSHQINAFASGRDPEHAVICVTKGCLNKLDRRELEGVLAHELGHVGNYDIRYATLVAVLVGMISIFSQIFLRSLWFRGGGSNENRNVIFIVIAIVLAILAPIVAYFVQMSISRKREYGADATAVKFTRYPEGLIGALKKIKKDHTPAEKKVSKSVAPLFFSNPFKGASRSHPPIDKRIETLKNM